MCLPLPITIPNSSALEVKDDMEKNQNRLVNQLQAVHARQQKVVLQLQAENTRLLSDLGEIRRERDSFRAEVARFRREHADIQNRLDDLSSDYHDLKREHANLVRSFNSASMYGARPQRMLSSKSVHPLSVLSEGDVKEDSSLSNVDSPFDTFRRLPNHLKVDSELPDLPKDNATSELGRSLSDASTTTRITSAYHAATY